MGIVKKIKGVESVWLIHRDTGWKIDSITVDDAINEDLLAGFITALIDFSVELSRDRLGLVNSFLVNYQKGNLLVLPSTTLSLLVLFNEEVDPKDIYTEQIKILDLIRSGLPDVEITE